jgi:hypothetical protein
MINNFLSIIKKNIDRIIIICSAILLFSPALTYFKLIGNRDGWYLREFCRDISLYLLVILCCINWKGSRKQKVNFILFFSVLIFTCLISCILAWVWNIHIHKTILILQYFPLAYIALKAYCDYKKGDTKDDAS